MKIPDTFVLGEPSCTEIISFCRRLISIVATAITIAISFYVTSFGLKLDHCANKPLAQHRMCMDADKLNRDQHGQEQAVAAEEHALRVRLQELDGS